MTMWMRWKSGCLTVVAAALVVAAVPPQPASAAKLNTILRAVLIPEDAQRYQDLARRRERPDEERYWREYRAGLEEQRHERGIGPDEAHRYEELSRREHHRDEERYWRIIAPALGAIGRMSPRPMRNGADIDTLSVGGTRPTGAANPAVVTRPATSLTGRRDPISAVLPRHLLPGQAGRIIRHSERNYVRHTYPTRVIRQDCYPAFFHRHHSLGSLCLFGSGIGEGCENRPVEGARDCRGRFTGTNGIFRH